MSALGDMSDALVTALRTVPNLRAGHVSDLTDPAPPVALVQPPVLAWTGYGDGPHSATFEVAVCVAFSDRALATLFDLVPLAVAAIEEVDDASVTEARPGTFRVGSNDLPCYSITVETSL